MCNVKHLVRFILNELILIRILKKSNINEETCKYCFETNHSTKMTFTGLFSKLSRIILILFLILIYWSRNIFVEIKRSIFKVILSNSKSLFLFLLRSQSLLNISDFVFIFFHYSEEWLVGSLFCKRSLAGWNITLQSVGCLGCLSKEHYYEGQLGLLQSWYGYYSIS